MDQREWDYGARMSRDRRAAEAWPTREPEPEPEPRWASLTDTGSMAPSDEALTWQRRADDWAEKAELEVYGGGGHAVEQTGNHWSDVAATGRTALPAEGTGWRTETAEWRATGARWRQTTEWRSSTGSHVWRSTTEAWQAEQELADERAAIPGTAWPTPEAEETGDAPASWQRRATTPVEQTPSWQRPSTQTPSWQQPSTSTPSWQQPSTSTPSWQQPSASTPSWQQSSATPSWQQSGSTPSWQQSGSTPAWQAGDPGSSRRGRAADDPPGENTTGLARWERTDAPGWQTSPAEDARHLVREDDRAAWRRDAAYQEGPRRGRRRAPEPDAAPAGGTGWSTGSESDNWARHTDTGSISPFGAPAPSAAWDDASGSGSRRGRRATTPVEYAQTPSDTGYLDDAGRADAAGPAGYDRPEPTRSDTQAGTPRSDTRAGAPRSDTQARGGRPRRYNQGTTDWREDTASWTAEPDTSNWTRDPDTGQWSRAEDDPRVLAWRAEAARREAMKGDDPEPDTDDAAPTRAGRRSRRGRGTAPDGPAGGVPGGPLPSSDAPGPAWPTSAVPDEPAQSGSRGMAMLPAPRSSMPSDRTSSSVPSSRPRSAMPGDVPWSGAPAPEGDPGRFRSGGSPAASDDPPGRRARQEGYAAAPPTGGRRRASEPDQTGRDAAQPYPGAGRPYPDARQPYPDAYPGAAEPSYPDIRDAPPGSRQARRRGADPADTSAEGWRQGPMPPRRELPAGGPQRPEPEIPEPRRESPYGSPRALPAGGSPRATSPSPASGMPASGASYGSSDFGRGYSGSGYGGTGSGLGHGNSDDGAFGAGPGAFGSDPRGTGTDRRPDPGPRDLPAPDRAWPGTTRPDARDSARGYGAARALPAGNSWDERSREAPAEGNTPRDDRRGQSWDDSRTGSRGPAWQDDSRTAPGGAPWQDASRAARRDPDGGTSWQDASRGNPSRPVSGPSWRDTTGGMPSSRDAGDRPDEASRGGRRSAADSPSWADTSRGGSTRPASGPAWQDSSRSTPAWQDSSRSTPAWQDSSRSTPAWQDSSRSTAAWRDEPGGAGARPDDQRGPARQESPSTPSWQEGSSGPSWRDGSRGPSRGDERRPTYGAARELPAGPGARPVSGPAWPDPMGDEGRRPGYGGARELPAGSWDGGARDAASRSAQGTWDDGRNPGYGTADLDPAAPWQGAARPASGVPDAYRGGEQRKPAYGSGELTAGGAAWPDPLGGTPRRPGAPGYGSDAGSDSRDEPPAGGAYGVSTDPADWLATERAGRRGGPGYRDGAGQGGETDWRQSLAQQSDLAEGESRRYDTSDFPPFRPSGSATVTGSSNLALSATSVISTAPDDAGTSGRPGPATQTGTGTRIGTEARTGTAARPGPDTPSWASAGPEADVDTSWPPRRSTGAFQGTGSYERRPVTTGLVASGGTDLLDPDDDEEDEQAAGGPLAAVGYTVVWYGVPVVLFVVGMFLLNSGQRNHALETLADAAPEFAISLALSIVVAIGLRWATSAWKAASVGLAAAVVGGGLATVLSSAITGNSLS
ncbi:hypothetical protein [Actinoplanes sp. DH11]|uniref:hypothetical protein n=1 Tax=Actinoplanes sp. DH11 TaxID=2857011 RepID=UPI001E5DF527|nr:hypothetical protein [Actinoplanes sp. DH11]